MMPDHANHASKSAPQLPQRESTVEPDAPTVRARLSAAGLSPARVAEHLAAGRLRVDGRPVQDLDEPAPVGARVVVWSE